MPGRFEIRSTVERPSRARRTSFFGKVLLEVSLRLGAGLLMVVGVTGAMRIGLSGLLLYGALFGPLLLLLAALIGYSRKQRHVSLVVGADGVALRRLGSTRFIPYSRIRRIGREGRHLVLEERAQPGLHLLVDNRRASSRGGAAAGAERSAHLDRLVARIEEARASYGKADLPAPLEALVGSAMQCSPAWLARVRRATRQEEYREGPLTAEALWPIVEDASIAPRQRLAAAIALRSDLDEAGRSRLRLAAESTLSPRVRVALEAALEEDDGQLTESFAELARDSSAGG